MKRIFYISFFILSISACRKPYNPPATSAPQSYLVVEGVINSGNDSTIFHLSRTVNITDTSTKPEVNAIVTIESDQGGQFFLSSNAAGVYFSGPLNLDKSKMYRLRIKTADNKEYLSDLVPATTNPPIDSIGFKAGNNQLQVYVNTHNPANNSRYYRWDYDETWKFHAKYNSEYYVVNGEVTVRPYFQRVYYCYKTDKSSNIVLGSSADLAQDVIYQNPVANIASTSEKIENEYSILLRQYALTKDAFNFWTNLKKNSEQLGSIFDAQPSQINGNIHCISNPAEPVIGYVSVTDVQSKRIFIFSGQLPSNWLATYPYDCEEDSTYLSNPRSGENEVEDFIVKAPPGVVDITSDIEKGGSIIGYFRTSPLCADCTLRGSTNAPTFWKQ